MYCTDPVQLAMVLLGTRGATPECVTYLLEIPSPPSLSVEQYGLLFGLTLALEAPVYHWVSKRTKSYLGSWSLAGRVFLLNLLTHPLVCFGFPSFAQKAQIPYGVSLALSELFAVLLEALVLNCVWHIKMGRALFAAFVANITSWWLGTWLVGMVW